MCVPVDPNLVQQYAGSYIQGFSDMAAGKQGAKIATMERNSALNASNYEADKMRREGQAVLGQTRAVQASSGVDITTGSAADVGAESAKNIEMDALTELYRGRLKAWNKDIEIDAHKRQAKGGQAQIYGTLLGGIVGGKTAKVAYGGW
jgi:hypothetical protein